MSLVDLLIAQATRARQPISGTFELTARCNLSCKMCYIHNISCDNSLRQKELTAQQWIQIADQAAQSGTLLLLLTGGEPMLRPDFCTIYRACAERGFLLTINTNGTLLNEEIFALLREHPPLRMNVSLYGMSENAYTDLCGNGAAFYKVTENLRRLNEMGIALQINFSNTPYNNHDIEAVHQFAKQLGVQVKHTAYMFPPTRTACQDCFQRFSPEDAARVTTEFMRLDKGDEEFTAFCKAKCNEPPPRAEDCGEISDSARCRAGRAAYWISYEGNMFPCGMIGCISHPVLSDSFAHAWQCTKEAFANIKMPAGCISCTDYDRCEVCPAICYAENEDFSAVPTYICRKNVAYRSILTKFANELEDSQCD